MNGRFDIRKVGQLLGFGGDTNNIDLWRVQASMASHLQAVLNLRSYKLTMGNFLENLEKIDVLRLRKGDKNMTTEKLQARLGLLEEIQKYINDITINGQNATRELERIQNNARHAS